MKEPAFKNIILISMDAISPERLSCYGYKRKTTPRTDEALTEGGAVFKRAFSQAPFTVMSHSSMLTSLYLLSHKVTDWTSKLNAESTLASIFKENGFATAGFTNHPCLSKKFGYDTGFDTFASGWRIQKLNIKKDLSLLSKTLKGILTKQTKAIFGIPIRRGRLEESCDYGLRWIERNRNSRFFLFLHLFSAHPFYNAPRPFGGLFLKDIPERFKDIRRRNRQLGYVRKQGQYSESEKEEFIELMGKLHDEEIAYNDHRVGSLIDTLKRFYLYRDTLIIITADHGNFLPRRLQRAEKPLLSDNNIHVQLIFINPNLKPRREIDSLAQVIDIFPTVFSFTGVETPAIAQGKDLKPAILNQAPGPHQYIYANFIGCPPRHSNQKAILSAIRSEEWKFIYDEGRGKTWLYNLNRDPQELNDLSSKLPEKADSFLKEYYTWKEKILRFELSPREKRLSGRETEQLRALGYIG